MSYTKLLLNADLFLNCPQVRFKNPNFVEALCLI